MLAATVSRQSSVLAFNPVVVPPHAAVHLAHPSSPPARSSACFLALTALVSAAFETSTISPPNNMTVLRRRPTHVPSRQRQSHSAGRNSATTKRTAKAKKAATKKKPPSSLQNIKYIITNNISEWAWRGTFSKDITISFTEDEFSNQ